MNKLLVSDSVILNSGEYNIKFDTKYSKININGEVILNIDNEIINKLDIILNDNSSLELYKYNDCNSELIVNIYQVNNSKLEYNESIVNDFQNKLIINNYIKGDNNYSNICIRNVCNKLDSEILINVNVDKNTINNVALEDLKGINNGGFIHIEPNIICNSNEVSANHLTTIGRIDIDSINYLLGKGININNAKDILLKGFIFSNMNDYIKDIRR